MNIDELNKCINDNDAVLVYFSGENCGVCKALQPKIKDTVTDNFPLIKHIYISATIFQETAASLSVFTIPTVIVFFEGKEFIRESRHISISSLIQKIERPYNLFFKD